MARKFTNTPPVPDEYRQQYQNKYLCLYVEWEEIISNLPDNVAGQLLKAIMKYAKFGEIPELDEYGKLAFGFIRSRIDNDFERGIQKSWQAFYAQSQRQKNETTDDNGTERTLTDADILTKPNHNLNHNQTITITEDKEIKPSHSSGFHAPTQEEVIAYFRNELNSTQNLAEDYYDYYTSCGWKVGNNKSMKDWKSAARRWVRNQSGYATKKKSGLGYDVATSFDNLPNDAFAEQI